MNWRGEIRAVIAISLLVVVVIAMIVLKQGGRSDIEKAIVVGFGGYTDDLGGHPIVIVAGADGQRNEVKATPPLLSGCSIGSQIHLLRKPHSLSVAPMGCR